MVEGIKGYRQLSELDLKNIQAIKEMEERCLRLHDGLQQVMGLDKRCLAIGHTNLQQAFMWYVRAIAQPERIELEDEESFLPFPPPQQEQMS